MIFFRNKLLDIFLVIFSINFIINILNGNILSLKSLNIFNVSSTIFSSLFFWYLVVLIKDSINVNSYSLSLVIFLSSYFIFDIFLLYFLIDTTFNFSFTFISISWIALLIIKSSNKINLVKTVLSFLILKLFNNIFGTKIFSNLNYTELNNDVIYQWIPSVSKIYEGSYAFGFTNNLVSNQGLFPSYIQALIHKLNFNTLEFIFVQSNSLLFIFFNALLFLDLKIPQKNKLKIFLLYLIFLLNNEWLFYLLINSLMIEGITAFLISTYLVNLNREKLKTKNINNYIYWFCFGLLVLTKQFVSIITVFIFIFILLVRYRNFKMLVVSMMPLFVDLMYKKYLNLNVSFVTYDDGLDYISIFRDIITLNDLNYSNILKIANQILIDKPLVIIVLTFLILNIINILNFENLKFIKNIFFYSGVINFCLVIILYISYWKNIEVASAYRYIIIFTNVYFISIADVSNKLKI